MLAEPRVEDESDRFSLIAELRIIEDLGGEMLGPRPPVD